MAEEEEEKEEEVVVVVQEACLARPAVRAAEEPQLLPLGAGIVDLQQRHHWHAVAAAQYFVDIAPPDTPRAEEARETSEGAGVVVPGCGLASPLRWVGKLVARARARIMAVHC